MALEKVTATFLATCILQLLQVSARSEVELVEAYLRKYNATASFFMRRGTVLFWKFSTGKIYNDEKFLLRSRPINWRLFQLHEAYHAKIYSVADTTPNQLRALTLIARETAFPKDSAVRRILEWIESKFRRIMTNPRIRLPDGRVLDNKGAIITAFKSTQDYDLLAEIWHKYRDATGRRVRRIYKEHVRALNKGAEENGYGNYARFEYHTHYNDLKMPSRVESLMSEVRPLFLELHAYTRWKLSQKYPGRFNKSGLIPAHLLGDIWAQTWRNIFPMIQPYPNKAGTDVTREMQRQNWTAVKMVKTCEQFFISMGFPSMTKKFWERSVLVKPPEKPNYNCLGIAKDFHAFGDFRIKMCIRPNEQFLKGINMKMGQIHYFMAYAHHPFQYKRSANPAFLHAVGATINLSMMTPKHLKKMGLRDQTPIDEKEEINYLMHEALVRVSLLPYAVSVDLWRWYVFSGQFREEYWNKEWWNILNTHQGLEAPVPRSETDLDPASKYHVVMNIPYIQYFVSSLLQFQFFEAACKASGNTGPLHQCDIYGSKSAGQLFKKMMSLGRYRPWSDALEIMTGDREVKTRPLRNYFAPLEAWLKKTREAQGYPIGW